MNIGVVVLDTLRYDVFSKVMTNTINRADHVFNRMYSTSRWTVPAHASLFTGYYPSEIGTHSGNQHLTTSEPILAEQLSASGFETYGFSNNPHIDSFFNFDRGFDHFHRGPVLQYRPTESTGSDWSEFSATLSPGLRKYPEAVIKAIKIDSPTLPTLINGAKLRLFGNSLDKTNSIDWFREAAESDLSSDGNDLFLFGNLMPCHSPYNPPKEYCNVEPHLEDPFRLTLQDEPVSDDIHSRQWDCYKSTARYLDDHLEFLFDFIDWDLLFIISDHGELFGEHGLRQHQYGVYEELIHVPAIAIGEAVPKGETTTLTNLLDIYRSILDIANVESSDSSRGLNLFNPGEKRTKAYAESTGHFMYKEDAKGFASKIPSDWDSKHFAYVSRNQKYIKDKDGERVIDLDTGLEVDEVTSMKEETSEFRSKLKHRTSQSPEKELTDDLKKKLQHLGYR